MFADFRSHLRRRFACRLDKGKDDQSDVAFEFGTGLLELNLRVVRFDIV